MNQRCNLCVTQLRLAVATICHAYLLVIRVAELRISCLARFLPLPAPPHEPPTKTALPRRRAKNLMPKPTLATQPSLEARSGEEFALLGSALP
jgi:hypothetical protein